MPAPQLQPQQGAEQQQQPDRSRSAPLPRGNARTTSEHCVTHMPSDPTCDVCSRAKLVAAPTPKVPVSQDFAQEALAVAKPSQKRK